MTSATIISVNTQACAALVTKLEMVHRSAFPLAVRGTLNALAFDVKTRTLDISAREHFIRRSPTFFKRFSGVDRAQGWNIDTMKATVGMTADTGGKDAVRARTAIGNMPVQEEGGQITEGLEYMNASRTASLGPVKTSRRWSNMQKLANNNFTWKGKRALTGGTTKSRMINSLFMSAYTQKVMKITKGNRNFYILVNSIVKTSNGKFKIDSKLLYESRDSDNKPVTASHFSKLAALSTMKREEEFWKIEAQKQIIRVMSK